MSASIYTKSALGSFYNIAVSGITMILGLLRSIALMRLLGVDSFGTISLALVFSRLVLPFSTLGLDHALLQKKAPSEEAYSTHFILRIGFSVLTGLLCLGISPIMRIGLDDLVVNIFIIFLVINIVDSTYATHFVILRREMRLGSLALINLCASIIMTILTPLAAYLGAGVWSLVLEQALGSIIRWGSAWLVLRPFKLSRRLSTAEARTQLSFGSQVIGGNLLGTVLDRFDDLWVGTALGSTALGYYSRAYDLTQYPERILSAPITSVFLSAYAALQEERQELAKLFYRSSSFLVRAGTLLSVIMVLTAPELVTLLFTPRWITIVPIFRLMTIYILLDPIYINLSSLLVGIGRPYLLNRVRLIQAGTFIPAVILFAHFWGTYGVAIAADVMMGIGVLLLISVSRRFIQYSLPRLWLAPAIAALVAFIVGYYFSRQLPVSATGLIFVLKAGFALAGYGISLTILEYKDLRQFRLSSIRPFLEGFGYFDHE